VRIHPDPCRRWFLKALALASALPFAARAAWAQEPPPARPVAPAAPAVPPVPPAPGAAPVLSPDVAPYTQILRNRHGQLVSDEQLAALAPDLDRMAQLGQRLRKTRLQNSDEPDFVFRATGR
jgi:hypothetical protein